MRRAGLAFAALLALVALVGTSCSSGVSTSGERAATTVRRTATATASTTLHGYPAYAAVVRERADVFDQPGGSVRTTLPAHTVNGAPETLLVREERRVGDAVWYRVLLPVKPNGTTGWVRATDVQISGLRYRLVVHLSAFTLDLVEGDHLVQTFPIGVGTDETPTPDGTYSITELLEPPDQNTIYGHYVFALSGFSEVLKDWPGGGVLGIHGTNDPDGSIGRKASHGCLRLRNEDIERLAGLLPLGTPVEVQA